MNACQIRVLSNGYLLSYMEMGTHLVEYCFESREEMVNFLDNTLMQAGEVQ